MGLAARVTGVTVAFALVAGGGYVVADMYDVVPGFVTLAPKPAPPEPFPDAPGAVDAPLPVSQVSEPSLEAPIPVGPLVDEQWLALDKRKKEIGKKRSLLVVDAATNEIVLDENGAAPRVPASTLKLLVGAAALMGPGADMTLDTTVVRGEGAEIFLVGGGDMMLAAEEGDAAYVNGRAGLGDLAEQVAAELLLRGQDEVVLRVDESLFTGPKLPSAVSEENVAAGYLAPVTPLAVNIAVADESNRYAPRQSQPSLRAADAFATALAKRGVSVRGEPSLGTAPLESEQLGIVSSAPLGEIVEFVLQTSDNTIAEVLGRLVALDAGLPGSVDGARSAVLAAVTNLGVDTRGVKLADSSGLGDGSAIPARTLVELVRRMLDPKTPLLRDAAVGLPIAGLTGTLYERFLASDARGLVRAKTGSLPGVTALAGTLVTADGRLLVFAVMLDAVPEGHAWDARAFTDKFVSSVAACGCNGG